MSEVLKSMQALGGQVTRKEVKREIRDHSEVISEEIVDEVIKSKKTGVPYHPFDYRFNFAVKHLITTGFITTEDNHNLELSEKGRMVKLEKFDPMRDVRAVLDKNKNTVDDNNSEESTETEEEPWKAELLAALAKMPPQKFEMFSRGLLIHMGVDWRQYRCPLCRWWWSRWFWLHHFRWLSDNSGSLTSETLGRQSFCARNW